ncbi:brefeldin A-inhibited guanine nucleotide-exchange protein 1-like isoform X2 [Neltuma alba]|uniref:brefeldin A-inhibited guanine nucleotide-exchange protein 1-like isoform X2 n=1 Tax=Neltuma alba TaxID=207710 RepID=UPI0010A4A65E|nr:brefeldin A-inhibited guanine nucleotide-exchange protein 1-like isoform X2 [Prosopis alba]
MKCISYLSNLLFCIFSDDLPGLNAERLLGEAQEIDCIMEKFVERYFKCNPNDKTDFIRNNWGIDDRKDLPEGYLGALSSLSQSQENQNLFIMLSQM